MYIYIVAFLLCFIRELTDEQKMFVRYFFAGIARDTGGNNEREKHTNKQKPKTKQIKLKFCFNPFYYKMLKFKNLNRLI